MFTLSLRDRNYIQFNFHKHDLNEYAALNTKIHSDYVIVFVSWHPCDVADVKMQVSQSILQECKKNVSWHRFI